MWRLLLWLIAAVPLAAHAQDNAPKLQTLEADMQDVTRMDTLDVGDPLKVFAFVLNALPERVTVYPTENYYYFRFLHRGTPYAGNIRIEVGDKPAVLHFAYYKTQTPWHPEARATEIVLGDAQGVLLQKQDRLRYRVTFGSKSVEFALNDLSNVKPQANQLAPDERFIGPVFDESGVRFLLVFNGRLKTFLYVVDDAVPLPEETFPAREGSRIAIGRRTGFAYFRDLKLPRQILIGVFEDNLLLNTYYDGPFDQLPDNFIEGEALRSAIVAATPRLKDRIDRFGRALDRNIRYAIKPYLAYVELSDLDPVERCATERETRANYYECFDAGKTARGNNARREQNSRHK
jgi:hypothetical protein